MPKPNAHHISNGLTIQLLHVHPDDDSCSARRLVAAVRRLAAAGLPRRRLGLPCGAVTGRPGLPGWACFEGIVERGWTGLSGREQQGGV